jgi:hypothetical protein
MFSSHFSGANENTVPAKLVKTRPFDQPGLAPSKKFSLILRPSAIKLLNNAHKLLLGPSLSR